MPDDSQRLYIMLVDKKNQYFAAFITHGRKACEQKKASAKLYSMAAPEARRAATRQSYVRIGEANAVDH